MPRPTTTATLLALALILTACGGSGGVDASSPAPLDDAAADGGTDAATDGGTDAAPGGATDGGAGGAAGACLEGTPDCVDADLSGGGAPPPELDTTFDVEVARDNARSLLGEPEDEVLERWADVRLGRHGDEEFMLTFDHRPGRMTIETDDDGTGTYRVVEVVLETEDATETLTAG